MNTSSILVDALNLAYWCGSPPSLRVPLGVLTPLLRSGREAVLYFDASTAYRIGDEAGIYRQLLMHARHCVQVPSGRLADDVILRQAKARGACVLSRDHYRDHRRRHRRFIDDPARLVGGSVLQDRIRIPALGLDVPLPASAAQAWEEFSALMQRV